MVLIFIMHFVLPKKKKLVLSEALESSNLKMWSSPNNFGGLF
jgi:hypothetical protein